MNKPLLTIVALIYLWTSINYYAGGRYGMSMAFLAYSLANIGFVFDLEG